MVVIIQIVIVLVLLSVFALTLKKLGVIKDKQK